MRRPPAWLAVTLLLALAGCGQNSDSAGSFEGEEARVAQTIEALENAAADEDAPRICRDVLTSELAQSSGDCRATVAAAIDGADATALTVEDVTITGDRARARVNGQPDGTAEDDDQTLELVRQGGRWRISSLGS